MNSYEITGSELRKYIFKGPPAGPVSESIAKYFPDFEFRPVRHLDELKTASEIVYQEYLKNSYILPHKNHRKYSLFQLLPSTVTFVAFHKPTNTVIATVTIVEDSPLGLPMDALYYEELLPFRIKNRKPVEFTMLATNRTVLELGALQMNQNARLLLLMHLFRTVMDHLRMNTTVDALAACFHPKHDSFYKMIAMEQLGKLKFFGKVKGNPAMARFGLFEKVKEEGRTNTGVRLFLNDLPERDPHGPLLRFTEENIRELFVDHLNILASATPEQLRHLQSLYPNVDLAKVMSSKSIFDHLIDSLDQPRANPSTSI